MTADATRKSILIGIAVTGVLILTSLFRRRPIVTAPQLAKG